MHPLRPGDPERIGAFSIVGLLGEGPRGAVFLGRESEDAPKVAIKLLPAEPESDREPDRYLGAKRVSSSYVARVLDAGYHDDRPYVVREYVEGKSLAETVADGEPLTGDALERVAVGVLTALSAVHLAGLAHRSLTPHNVILGPDGPRVTDAAIGDPVGDAAYQAPEQLEGRPYGPYADVFAWAATIVYAGTGRPPFADREAALNGDPDVGITAEPLRRVLMSALTREVGSRPTTYSALMQVLGDAPKTPDTPAAKPEAAAAAAAAVAPAPAAPAADSSKTDAPTPAAPKPAEPAADGPEPGGPAAETAESGQPEVGEQKPDGPVADASKPNEPVAGEPKAGAPVAAESKAGAPGPQSGGAGGEGPEAPAPRRAPEGPPLEGVTIARLPMPGGPPQGPPMQGPLQGPLQGPPQGPLGPHVPPQGPPPPVPAQGGPLQGMPQGGVPMQGPPQGPPHGPLSGPNLPPQGPPSGPHVPPPHVPGPPLQGTPVPGPGMQGPGMHGPGMQGPQGPGANVPVPHQQGGPESQAPQLQGRPVTPESTMWAA
ncbi:serine/threonine-protein kinase [Nonomuraea salmonea]|uniref:serine/threonine-protein kinase n=1 Tax=Nonomuraea salmonea TaxID=46181 RepID=UPI00361172C8